MKERDGTMHKERENKRAPKLVSGVPVAPPYLAKDEREAWGRFAQVLHNEYKILSKHHFAAFERLVVVWAQARRIDAEIRGEKTLTLKNTRIDKLGNAVTVHAAHPLLTSSRAAGSELRQLLGVFGLTPADLGRVSALSDPDAGSEVDPDREFVN